MDKDELNKIFDNLLCKQIYENVEIKNEDYHIYAMNNFAIKDKDKTTVYTAVDYSLNNKVCRKIYEHILED